eukprot:449923-Alexandrium_andersonii.AAC.1
MRPAPLCTNDTGRRHSNCARHAMVVLGHTVRMTRTCAMPLSNCMCSTRISATKEPTTPHNVPLRYGIACHPFSAPWRGPRSSRQRAFRCRMIRRWVARSAPRLLRSLAARRVGAW